MASERNALAELAERQRIKIEHQGYVYEQHRMDDIACQRIVAELAKHANISLIPADCYGCSLIKTIVDCRAIAEEGSEDGK